MTPFKELAPGESFQFACHPDVPCFNTCCRDLTQFLTPYDIMRLKKRLGLSSGDFLQTYTAWHVGPESGLPVVTLRALAAGQACPFVSTRGCTVYEDRPGACRTYPLGRMASRKSGSTVCHETYFLIREPHCRGFEASKEWTAESWNRDQALSRYNAMNDLMMDVIAAKRKSGRKALSREDKNLFYMACYDLDRFKDYVSEKGLWQKAPHISLTKEALAEDDAALITFALQWIARELFGGWTPHHGGAYRDQPQR